LSVFDDVFTKIDLFKKIVNARFLHKSITVGQSGFGVVTSSESQLDPVLLSSGEQHELVILYELLFRVSKNSIILIDEPEISLHVAWQDEFLKDLGQMAELSQFNALVATHSPQIISDRWDLTVELKGPAE
jgi:predicted ATP-binding protein involved in virulence